MTFGVPQGSVLGPLLFLIYINDMTANSEFSQTLFADDTCLFMSHKRPETLRLKVNHEIQKIHNWLIANKLTLNLTKSCFILFKGQRNDALDNFHISISGSKLEYVKSTKYLGVTIDEEMNWKEHIANTLQKIKQGKGILRK